MLGHFRVSLFLDNSSHANGIDPKLSDRDAEISKACAAKMGAALEKETGALTVNDDAGADQRASS